MRQLAIPLLTVALWGSFPNAQTQTPKPFDTYVIDVEGGEATLFVSPSGESMLVDTGWPGFDGRDADRIAAAATDAGVKQIDYLIVTHFHADHMGGTAQLAARLPIRHFIDHGSTVDQGESARIAFQSYADVRQKGIHSEAVPGDRVPIAGLNVQIVATGGSVLRSPLAGAGKPNPLCDGFTFHGAEITKRAGDAEDLRSVSLVITYGKFRTIIMGDLTWNKEYDLMCPNNNVGSVDVYLVSHHGSDTSGSAALVHALRPRVAIMNNGPTKGGAIQTFQMLRAAPGLEDLWQNHYSIPGGEPHNRPELFIANLEEGRPATLDPQLAAAVHMGAAHWIKLSTELDGGFTVTNSRTGYSKRYAPKN